MQSPSKNVTRREFLRTSSASAAALGALSLAGPLAALAQTPSKKLRLAIVGTGMRGTLMWGKPLVDNYPEYLEIVGLCDINPKRVEASRQIINPKLPTFTDFDQMVRQTKPESIIVTTVDAIHSQYVIRAMELGCDVLCEKPITTDEEKCQAIIDAQKRLGKKITVTFNARYGNPDMKIKELLMNQEIGEVYSADYSEFLNLTHGADYFRRWHRLKQCSGTLLVHKASHHFDQLNWWLDSDPVEVTAYGALKKYGSNGSFRHINCRQCVYKKQCDFYWDVTKTDFNRRMYVECESEDGYYRDGCVFRHDVNIYDTMSAQVQYVNKALVSYTLNATVPYEGQFIVFNGSKGRIEARCFQTQPWEAPYEAEIRLTRNYKDSVVIPIAWERGEHGGADNRIRDMIFKPGVSDDLGQRAGMRAGIMSSAIGIAAYRSIETGRRIRIRDLVNLG